MTRRDAARRARCRGLLESWGYRVTTRGNQILAAGHGALHRWRGWAAVPDQGIWRAGCDGAAQPNPGPAACGAWLRTPLGDVAWTVAASLGRRTTHEAEWLGLSEVLQAARAFGASPLQVQADSQVVVRQFQGVDAVRGRTLVRLADKARRLAAGLAVAVTWVPRAQNREADALSRVGLRRGMPVFDADRLEGAGPQRFIAHGTTDYTVDLRRRTCTCPAFQYRGGLCKHLRAALDAARAG
jgi:ribonuclease HI